MLQNRVLHHCYILRFDMTLFAPLRRFPLLAKIWLLIALSVAIPFATLNAQPITTVVGTGIGGSIGEGTAATGANLFSSNGLALDANGNLYIADSGNHRVRKVGLDGIISTVAGNGTAGFSGDGAAAKNAQLNYPVNLAFTASGDLLIADYGNHRIRRVAADGVISTIAGTGTEGSAGDGAAATAAQLNNPIGLAVGADGSVFIGDAQNHRVRKIGTGGIISTVAGNGTAGFAGDGAAATSAQLNFPGALAIDAAGNLFIADYANNRVRKLATDGVITTYAGTGTAGFTGDAGVATAAQLSGPFALAIGGNGSLLIADQNNGRIRRVGADGVIKTVAGGAATTGDINDALRAFLSAPSGIVRNAAGQYWISDRGNHIVRKVAGSLRLLTEYRYTPSDYFFYTSRDGEKFALDNTAGWARTGASLIVNTANDAGSKAITRYFFDRVAQNQSRGSHFYTLIDGEIAGLNALNPGNVRAPGLPFNEGVEAYAFPTTNGACAANTTPVYRAFRNAVVAPDNPTHRYSANLATYNDLVAAGWNAEGIVFCSAIAP
jgi:sugar lactone lactonase YvrE